MAKSKKQPHVQLLSPENYIRQKARNLPIYECWINEDWKKMGSAEIVISRIHANGNITMAMYMTDLLCMGVKDTLYVFNSHEDDYRDLLETLSEELEMIKTDYTLVHNIIFAANDFAAELGFSPHKDFTSVSQYLLEEDTDDIELIEIECGREGKPLFVRTENTSDTEVNRIIKKLEKAVGKGNFDMIYGTEGDEMDFEDEDEGEFTAMDKTERRKLFLEITKNGIDNLNEEERGRLMTLTNCIYIMDVCDDQAVDDLIDSWEVEAEMEMSDREYTTESLGASPESIITLEDMDQFEDMEVMLEKKPKATVKLLSQLRAKWGNIPFVCYMELKYLQKENPKEYIAKLEEYSALYPNYALIKLLVHASYLITHKGVSNIQLVSFEDIFGDRSSITNFEMFDFQTKKLYGIMTHKSLNELNAMYSAIDDLKLNEMYHGYLKTILLLTRFNFLKEHFDNN
jgi:hypothetical protein